MRNRRGRRLDARKGRIRSDECQALGDEIVRIAADLRAREAELARLRDRYDELAEKRRHMPPL